jgi:UDP-glucose 4-epimerase
LPNNLMPYVAQVAAGTLPFVQIFGDDYETQDGTGVRDYIHVMDLADAHLSALSFLGTTSRRHSTYNVGTGRGCSVYEVIRTFENACELSIPVRVAPRRTGDVASCFADSTAAAVDLGWRARRGLDEMCLSAWRFQQKHSANT